MKFLVYLVQYVKNLKKTSISEATDYPNFCKSASKDDQVFRNFRNQKEYMAILEHVTFEQGLDYINEIKKLNITNINFFDVETPIGGPLAFNYEGYGQVSPTTLRYLKVYLEISKIFNNKTINSFCEIGAGYGGQARIFSLYSDIRNYVIYDLPEVKLLIEKFLLLTLKSHNIEVRSYKELQNEKFDLVISNYAFSELKKNLQDRYLKNVIERASCGYMTYNDIYPYRGYGYTVEEIAMRIPGSEIIEEKPLTSEGNCILIWGHNLQS